MAPAVNSCIPARHIPDAQLITYPDSGHGVLVQYPACSRPTSPDSKRLARCYDWLGKRAGEVFPARFESDVELTNGPLTGCVPGFMVLEDFQTRKTRTVN